MGEEKAEETYILGKSLIWSQMYKNCYNSLRDHYLIRKMGKGQEQAIHKENTCKWLKNIKDTHLLH